MSCSRQTNNMSNELHERVLSIVLNDQTSNFKTLIFVGTFATIIEIFKHSCRQACKIQNKPCLCNNGNYKEPTRVCKAKK